MNQNGRQVVINWVAMDGCSASNFWGIICNISGEVDSLGEAYGVLKLLL